MTKRATRKHAAKRHEQPAAIEIKRPKDEPTLTVTPVSDAGLGHQIAAAHDIDEAALAKRKPLGRDTVEPVRSPSTED